MVLGALEGDGGWHFCSWYSAAVGTIWPIFSSLQLFLHSKMYRDEFRDLRALLDYWKAKKNHENVSKVCKTTISDIQSILTITSFLHPLFCPDQLDQRQIKCILTGQLRKCLFIVQGLFSIFQKVKIFFSKCWNAFHFCQFAPFAVAAFALAFCSLFWVWKRSFWAS